MIIHAVFLQNIKTEDSNAVTIIKKFSCTFNLHNSF